VLAPTHAATSVAVYGKRRVLRAFSQAARTIALCAVRVLRSSAIARGGAVCAFAGVVARGANAGAGFQAVSVWASLGVGKFVRRLRPNRALKRKFSLFCRRRAEQTYAAAIIAAYVWLRVLPSFSRVTIFIFRAPVRGLRRSVIAEGRVVCAVLRASPMELMVPRSRLSSVPA
jgi:hypothetical protein